MSTLVHWEMEHIGAQNGRVRLRGVPDGGKEDKCPRLGMCVRMHCTAPHPPLMRHLFLRVLEEQSTEKPHGSDSWRNVALLQPCSSALFFHVMEGCSTAKALALCSSDIVRNGAQVKPSAAPTFCPSDGQRNRSRGAGRDGGLLGNM